MKNFTYRANWFLPGQENNQLSGLLSFDIGKGGELELDGNFDRNFFGDFNNPEIILGITSKGDRVTLYNCKQFHKSDKSIFKVQFIIKGHYFQHEKELMFNKVRCEFNYLAEWIGIYGFSQSRKQGNLEIKLKQPLPINFKIAECIEGEFDFDHSISSDSRDKIILYQNTYLTIKETQEDKPLKVILENLKHFQNFLTLGCFSGAYPTSIQLFNNNFKDKAQNKEYLKPLNLYYNLSYHKFIKAKNAHDFLFRYSDIKEKFEQIIQKWFSLKETIGPVTDLLLESFYNASFFNENRFLNIAQGLETFHRRLKNNLVKPEKEHKSMIDEIISQVGADHKGWLQEKLKFSNEPTLHNRLEQIAYSDSC